MRAAGCAVCGECDETLEHVLHKGCNGKGIWLKNKKYQEDIKIAMEDILQSARGAQHPATDRDQAGELC